MAHPPEQKLTPLEALKASIRGAVLQPSEPAFDELLSPCWNKEVLRSKPSLIIKCKSTHDVVRAVNYVREQKLDFTVAGGRHSLYCTKQDAVMIDLSGGARNDDLDDATAVHGLATTAGTNSDTGIGGLGTGAGWGYLAAKHGLTIDNCLEVEIVTADGNVHVANAKENADLFWAVRGAGPNFGIVTQFTLQLHVIGHVAKDSSPEQKALAGKIICGPLIHPWPAATAALTKLHDWLATLNNRDVSALAALAHGPDMKMACIVVPVFTGNDINEGFKALAEIRSFGPPVVDGLHPDTYSGLQHSMDPMTPPANWSERATLMGDLTPEVIKDIIAFYQTCPKGCERSAILVMPFRGAPTDLAPDATAFYHRRNAKYWVAVVCPFAPEIRDTATAWTKAFKAATNKYSVGQYANIIEPDGTPSEGFFGTNLPKLRTLKAKYDPTNLFKNNNNILPAAN